MTLKTIDEYFNYRFKVGDKFKFGKLDCMLVNLGGYKQAVIATNIGYIYGRITTCKNISYATLAEIKDMMHSNITGHVNDELLHCITNTRLCDCDENRKLPTSAVLVDQRGEKYVFKKFIPDESKYGMFPANCTYANITTMIADVDKDGFTYEQIKKLIGENQEWKWKVIER